ncbi:hypothetical protein QR680_018044 [Steinernema hermaphroditum]|uniref:Uncharacterized protein n=1 Tax=Steinernema hermaphroditum TaxID=289476 RepID=A0AA39HIX9_9BILA|nr:hypothetical protein QR680_018044 [Steinernema hermaphroditum]
MVAWTNTALWLLATVAVASALFPRILDDDDLQTVALKRAYQSWDSSREVDHNVFEKTVKRAKRDVSQQPLGNVNSACQLPGYTGQHCEFPICTEVSKNFTVPKVDDESTLESDFVSDLSPIPFVVDETTPFFSVHLTSSQGVGPRAVVKTLAGEVVPLAEERPNGDDAYAVFYSNVPAGTYYVVPSTLSPILEGFQMHYQIRSKSSLQVNAGFIAWSQENKQPERNDFPSYRVVQNELAVAVVKPHGLYRPGSLSTISFYKDSQLISRPQPLQIRYGCAFEYYFESFFCREPGHYILKIDGIDFMGNNFRRVSSFVCEVSIPIGPTPSPTPTVPTNVSSCDNNGLLITNKDGSNECFCPEYFWGPTCSTPVCMNGGTLEGDECFCKAEFSGSSCQDVKCLDNAGYKPFFSHPMLVLVVRIRQSMNDVVNQLVAELQAFKNLMTSENDYLEDIAVVTFNNDKPEYRVFRSFTDTINFFSTQNNSVDTTGNNCEDSVLSALLEVLDRGIITYRSPVYVITDAVPSDPAMMDAVFNLDSFWNSPIYFTLLQQPAGACDVSDIYSQGFAAIDTVARRSSGLVLLANTTDFAQLFQQHMQGTFFRSHLLRSNDLPQCGSQLGWQAIAVDTTVDNLHFTATGDDLRLILTDTFGNEVTGRKFFKEVVIGRNYFWTYHGAEIGVWTFQIISGNPITSCSYRAYASRGIAPASTDYRLFWGWTPVLGLDAPLRQPHFRKDVSLVVHLEQVGRKNLPEKPQAEVIVWATHDDKPELVFAANGLWRDGCEHQFYFPPFQCNHPDEDLYFIIYTRDVNGDTIQRAGNALCTKNQPTIAPPDGCLNGAVDLDGKCVCTPLWEGDKCEKRRCFNGGTPNGVVCECLPGHAGESCEITTCSDKNPEHDFGPVHRQMVFVIDTTMNNFRGIGDLHQYLPSIVRDIHSQNPSWISHYTIIGYNSSDARFYHLQESNNTDAFANTLQKMADQALDNADVGCEVKMWEALDYAATIAGQNGYIFLFQGALPAAAPSTRIVDVYNTIAEKRIMVNLYLSVLDQNKYMCNGTDDDFSLLYELAKYTEGQTYGMLQADFGNILRTIPSLYSSGLVVRRKVADCSTAKQTFYIPVDAFTQTLTITYFSTAQVAVQTLYKPNGSEASGDIITKIVPDNIAGVQVTEVRRPCDPDWDSYSKNQSCVKKITAAVNWTDAQKICSDAGGYLVDDMFSSKNSYLEQYAGVDVWLGLNDLDTVGKFVWDRGVKRAGEPIATEHYTQWADGSNLNDANNRCVAWFASDHKWHITNCSEKRAFICQKHKYSDQFTPNRLENDDDIPAGKWRFDLQAKQTTDGRPASCYFEVRAQSSIQVYSGFTNDEHGDYPSLYPVSGSDQNRIITHLSGYENRIMKPHLTYSLLYDEANFTFYNGVAYEKRDFCAYPFVSQTFDCPNYQDPENAFAAVHVGEDEFGFAFQRVTSGHCRTKLTSCDNNGVVYKGKCECPELYTGMQCETPVCVNGGALDKTKNACTCPEGFTGVHCELGQCYNTSIHYTHLKNDGKTFALVVENTKGNLQSLKQIGAQLSQIIEGAQAASPDKKWFNSYVLVTFDSKNADLVKSTDPKQFVQAFKDKTANPTDDSANTACQYPIYGSLMRSMHSANFVRPGSVIYLVARGLPSDWENMNDFSQLLTDSQAQLYFTYIKDDACGEFDSNSTHFLMLSSFVYGSDGNVFYIDSEQLANHMETYIPTIYDSQLLAVPTFNNHNCFQLTQSVMVDQTMDVLWITAHYDKYSSISVVDPFGNNADVEKYYTDKDTSSYIYRIDTRTKPGIYVISINSPSASTCLVQVRGQHGVQVWLGFVYGESNPEHQDDPQYGPAYGVENTLVAHKDPLSGHLISMELYSTRSRQVHISPLYPRFGCSFEYYSDPFKCIDSAFVVVINGYDADGQNFRRESLFECPQRGSVVPTTSPSPTPTPTVLLTTTTPMTKTNTKFDVFLFVDTSGDVNKDTFEKDVVQFVLDVFSNFDMSRNGINFAVFAIDGTAPLPTWSLGRLSSPDQLRQSLRDLGPDFDKEQGQTLKEGLDILTGKNVVNDPNFNLIDNKVLIYLTSTAKPAQDAIDKANQLRTAASNKIGFLTVAYPSDGSNADALKQFTGGDSCTFVANDVTTLNSFSTKIVDKIWNAAQSPDATYC